MSKSLQSRVEVLEAAVGGLGIDLRQYDPEHLAAEREAAKKAEEEAAAKAEAERREADARADAEREAQAKREEEIAARAQAILEQKEKEDGKAKTRKR